jgi:lipopolysaccharide/colanic/teichoic acid biosynthesis glycosyltransferase
MYEAGAKRAFDLAAASLALLALAPVFLAVAVAVLLALGRPVLFTQRRAGRGGAPFAILKFRSMAPGDAPDGARLTRFGQRLRASGLDELPQLLNVLRGEMSLVGPRPLPASYLAHYSPRQALRLRARPGLVGPSIAAGRHAIAWAERLERDAAYGASPAHLLTDLRLLAQSLLVWLSGRGATPAESGVAPDF